MCGVHGIVQFEGSGGGFESRIQRMHDMTAHRGPDQYDIKLFPQAALGASRLAIVAPEEHSTVQSLPGSNNFAVYNGEIVNHRSLRDLLPNPPQKQADTALILPLHERYGENFATKLAGMFAIGIYDHSKHQLQLWRDQLGVKPLYYHNSGREVIFSSEVKAIYSVMDNPPPIDFAAADHILKYRFHSGRSTIFPGIERVMPGETITFKKNKEDHRRYWELKSNATETDLSYDMAGFQDLFEQVVGEHAQADVKGGFFVSGGLDSSLVTAAALKQPSTYETPISIAFFPKPVVDEGYGKLLEKFFGRPFEWVTLSDEVARKSLEELVSFIDEPLENPIHVGTYLMAQRAKELGIKSILTGDGSDEFFLGYDRIAMWFRDLPADPSPAYIKELSTMKPKEAGELYTEKANSLVRPMIDVSGQPIEPLRNVDQVLQFERFDHLSEYHNMRVDRMTMTHSVEARVPFEDPRLVEYSLKIPLTTLFGSSAKEWLGEASRPFLPPEIIDRSKVHFPSLPDQWLSGEGAKWASEILLDPGASTKDYIQPQALEKYLKEHGDGTKTRGRLLWAITTLELWLQNLPNWRNLQK